MSESSRLTKTFKVHSFEKTLLYAVRLYVPRHFSKKRVIWRESGRNKKANFPRTQPDNDRGAISKSIVEECVCTTQYRGKVIQFQGWLGLSCLILVIYVRQFDVKDRSIFSYASIFITHTHSWCGCLRYVDVRRKRGLKLKGWCRIANYRASFHYRRGSLVVQWQKKSREKIVASFLCPLIAAHYSLVISDAHSSSFYRDLAGSRKWRK